jgi:hypothetical protein
MHKIGKNWQKLTKKRENSRKKFENRSILSILATFYEFKSRSICFFLNLHALEHPKMFARTFGLTSPSA